MPFAVWASPFALRPKCSGLRCLRPDDLGLFDQTFKPSNVQTIKLSNQQTTKRSAVCELVARPECSGLRCLRFVDRSNFQTIKLSNFQTFKLPNILQFDSLGCASLRCLRYAVSSNVQTIKLSNYQAFCSLIVWAAPRVLGASPFELRCLIKRSNFQTFKLSCVLQFVSLGCTVGKLILRVTSNHCLLSCNLYSLNEMDSSMGRIRVCNISSSRKPRSLDRIN